MKPLILFALCLTWQLSWSQGDNSISLDNLEVPNTPAFILLDEAPTTIQRPNSTRAFAIDLLQDISDDGLLGNIAVEVTPFWMVQHKNMTPLKFYGISPSDGTSVQKQNPFAKLRLASVSAAYVKSPDSIVNVSVGVRTTVFEIKRSMDIDDYLNVYNEIHDLLYKDADYAEAFEEEMNYPEPEEDQFANKPQYLVALQTFRKARSEYIDKREKQDGFERGEYVKKFQEIVNRKPAVAVDIAVAYNQRFYGNTFNNNGSGRFGVWSTVVASTFLDKDPTSSNYVNIYGFVRYLNDDSPMAVATNSDERFNAFDIGIKGELEFKKLIMAYEYIDRSGDMEGYRSVGTIKYQLWNDIVITGSFGNNFELTDDLVTLFGIKWGLNHPLQKLIVPKD